MNKFNLFLLNVLSVSLIVTTGCKQITTTDVNNNTKGDSIQNVLVSIDTAQKKTLHIDSFSQSPETDSCSCLFSVDSALYTSKQYIFAYDLSLTSFMKINGEMIKFNQTEYTGAGKNSLIYFSGGEYQLILESANSQEAGKEKTIQTGSIRVMDKQGNAFITTYYGICGCFKPGIKD